MDLDLMDEEERGESSLGKDVDGEVGGSGGQRRAAPVVFRVDGDVNGDPLDERETMMVTKWLRVSCSGEAMRLESMARHGQDGDDDERWFWP
jgi:hypothetical protein